MYLTRLLIEHRQAYFLHVPQPSLLQWPFLIEHSEQLFYYRERVNLGHIFHRLFSNYIVFLRRLGRWLGPQEILADLLGVDGSYDFHGPVGVLVGDPKLLISGREWVQADVEQILE